MAKSLGGLSGRDVLTTKNTKKTLVTLVVEMF
jgi:hypothetical protein